MIEHLGSLAALAGLGAFHGVNPGMGWLFAVALGLQDGGRRAVWRALVPLGVGHALAVGGVVGLAALTGVVVPTAVLEWVVAGLLVGLGVRRLVRHRHPRFGGMRVGPVGLTVWSCLMATAHGAGLMVLPVVMAMGDAGPMCHTAGASSASSVSAALTATFAHGVGYLAVTAIVAVLVFEKVGVGIVRRAWFNLDLIWAAALIVAGAATVIV
jgi:hypothetical protein